jgi:hypothetical protein
MAYVVARPRGRFEIRESVHTPKGPRARSLANFAELSDEVLATARRRASRPFDADAVRSSARRAGTPTRLRRTGRAGRTGRTGSTGAPEARRFVEASRRMSRSLETRPPGASGARRDPGDTLIALLDFAEQINPFTPDRAHEELVFPPLAQVAQETRARHTR